MLLILQFKMCYLCATPTHLYLTIWRGCFEENIEENTFGSTMGKTYKRKRKITLEQVHEHLQKNAQTQQASTLAVQNSIQQQIEKRRAERGRPVPMPLPGHFVLPHSPTQPSNKPASKPPPRPLVIAPYSPTTGPHPSNRGEGPQTTTTSSKTTTQRPAYKTLGSSSFTNRTSRINGSHE